MNFKVVGNKKSKRQIHVYTFNTNHKAIIDICFNQNCILWNATRNKKIPRSVSERVKKALAGRQKRVQTRSEKNRGEKKECNEKENKELVN